MGRSAQACRGLAARDVLAVSERIGAIAMRLLDLFCGAGGAAMGYHRAGFTVTGVDIEPQPHYPFEFIQRDVMEYISADGWWAGYDIVHASPPCQAFTRMRFLTQHKRHPDLLTPTRNAVRLAGIPFVIENVPGAPLENPIVLCGTMFGLRVLRHRLFETNPEVYFLPGQCQHIGMSTGRKNIRPNGRLASLSDGFSYVTVTGHSFLVDDARQAMGIDWMTGKELAQAIPPAYTEWLGRRILEKLERLQ